jgi:hypothetical protein
MLTTDFADSVAESANGVTSDLLIHSISGFSTPRYNGALFPLNDASVRLYVPEPGLAPSLLAFSAGLLLRRKRRA